MEEANAGKNTTAPQSVKLQKYTITLFSGDYKDWLRLWNQFTVEVDGAAISEISKFNYLLELVKGKPKEDILGLAHTEDGYGARSEADLEQIYGKDIKVHKALIKEMEELSAILNIHKIAIIHDFYSRLSRVVRTLNTMKKLASAQSMVYTLMDKLGPVREILVQKDDDWEEWGLEQLVESLRRYVQRNPLRDSEDNKRRTEDFKVRPWIKENERPEKLLFGNNGGKPGRKPNCVYCNSQEHNSLNCTKKLDIAARPAILQRSGLCWNCTGGGHGVTQCRSRGCKNCNRKHHTYCTPRYATKKNLHLINFRIQELTRVDKSMSALMNNASTLHPTVLAKVGEKEVRVMFDSGAGSSYVSNRCDNQT